MTAEIPEGCIYNFDLLDSIHKWIKKIILFKKCFPIVVFKNHIKKKSKTSFYLKCSFIWDLCFPLIIQWLVSLRYLLKFIIFNKIT